jgi:hypothetical protein
VAEIRAVGGNDIVRHAQTLPPNSNQSDAANHTKRNGQHFAKPRLTSPATWQEKRGFYHPTGGSICLLIGGFSRWWDQRAQRLADILLAR